MSEADTAMNRWTLKPARDLDLSESERFRSYDREGGLISATIRLFWWTAIRTWFRLWHRLEVRGLQQLPAVPSFVIVANHCSHLDALAIAAALPQNLRRHCVPLAAGEVFFETPGICAFSAICLNALPLWRRHCGRHTLEKLRQRMQREPTIYILFPEGTRSRDGQLASFKSGIGMLLAETAIPAIPCHLQGTFDALAPGRMLPRRAPIRLAFDAPLRFEHVQSNREGWKRIATEIEQQIRSLAGTSGSNVEAPTIPGI